MPERQRPRKHSCGQCGQTFTKAEHLVRHQRSHSGLRPYRCHHCNHRFARPDTLSRHSRRQHDVQSARQVDLPNGSTVNDTVLPDTAPLASPNMAEPLGPDGAYHSADDADLNWPDSEDLLQSILNTDLGPWPQAADFMPLQIPPAWPTNQANGADQTFPDSMSLSAGNEGTHAVNNLSYTIQNLSASVTTDIQLKHLTTQFLDGCLHMFFTQFNVAFPVLHRPTFVFRNCIPPLLLNAIAVGSLSYGDENAVALGEALWKLAHISVATSWQNLMNHQGQHDSCHGLQLVLTALLGQTYAILSRNSQLRMTAQIFHSLGFYWARRCGMYDEARINLQAPLLSAPDDDKIVQWKKWAARETQLRAILGHYLLDGQIAHYSSSPTCQRHISNPLQLPCSDKTWDASAANEWIVAMTDGEQHRLSFRSLFSAVFSQRIPMSHLNFRLSHFSAQVVLEGIYALVLESGGEWSDTVAMPSRYDVSRALARLYYCLQRTPDMSASDKSNALLRWHALSIDLCVDSVGLCRDLCYQLDVGSRVFRAARLASKEDSRVWTTTAPARLVLLHAIAMTGIVQQLPIHSIQTVHGPSSLISAATVFAKFVSDKVSTTNVPEDVDWVEAMSIDLEMLSPQKIKDLNLGVSPFVKYLVGVQNDSTFVSRNIFFDLNTLHTFVRSLKRPWGVSADVQHVLDGWISRLRST